jgi:hypothetical protein
MLLCTQVNPALALERWVKNPVALGKYHLIASLLSALSTLGLLGIGIAEWKIWKGWEPSELRRMYTGVSVVSIYRETADPKGYMRIEVTWVQDGIQCQEWFMLDPDELSLCKVGDLVHLSAIGKHVANIINVRNSSWKPKLHSPMLWHRVSEFKQSRQNHLLMCLFPVIAGAFWGKGLEHVIYQEMVLQSRRRVTSLLSSGSAQFFGWVMIFVGAIIIGCSLFCWYRGWDDSLFEE